MHIVRAFALSHIVTERPFPRESVLFKHLLRRDVLGEDDGPDPFDFACLPGIA